MAYEHQFSALMAMAKKYGMDTDKVFKKYQSQLSRIHSESVKMDPHHQVYRAECATWYWFFPADTFPGVAPPETLLAVTAPGAVGSTTHTKGVGGAVGKISRLENTIQEVSKSLSSIKDTVKYEQKQLGAKIGAKNSELSRNHTLVNVKHVKNPGSGTDSSLTGAAKHLKTEKEDIHKEFKAFRIQAGVKKRRANRLNGKLIAKLKTMKVDVTEYEEEFRKIEEDVTDAAEGAEKAEDDGLFVK